MALIDDFSITLNYNCSIVFTFLDTILSSICRHHNGAKSPDNANFGPIVQPKA
uniref:Uncharacterized protein n=1 Tax=Rhizophagus irregularis (strain DAOM 181602 / DAOM 197198 / MUCL 43194) TaxID=747089 RepID=U9UAH4_RHIID